MIKTILNAWRGQAPLPAFVPASDSNPVVVSLARQKPMTFAAAASPRRPRAVRFFAAAGHARNQSSWLSSDTAINALLESQLYIMRARSRYLTRNTSQGKRYLTLVKNNVIGPDGIKVHSRCGNYVGTNENRKWQLDTVANDAIEAHYKTWSESKHCDVTGQSSLEEICRMLAANLAQDGEIIVKEVIGTKATPYRYQLQVLVIDRLDINYNGVAANGNQIRMGVEADSAGKPVAYYVLLRNPNDSRSLGMQKHERIGADEIIHRFVKCEAEQKRGFPWTHAVMNGERMLGMFQDAALEASVVGATTMGFFTQAQPGEANYIPPNDDSDPVSGLADGQEDDGSYVMDAVGASFRMLPEGVTDLKQFNPNYPTQSYGPFVKEVKLDLAAGLDVANHNLSGDMTGVNYSSARIAELNERDVWRALQKWFINHFMRHITERWLEMSLLSGAITLANGSALPVTGFDKFRAGLQYVPRGWDWVDPAKEVAAAVDAIDQGLTTRTKVTAAKGGDWEENIIELAREEELIRQHKVSIGQMAKPSQAAPAPDNTQGDSQNE